MEGSIVTPTGVSIPPSCSVEQLFQDADEVVTLSTNFAHLQDQIDSLYFNYYFSNDVPPGMSEKGREVWALQQIKTNHPDLWTEQDATKARMKGLTLKASIVNSATRIASLQYDHSVSPGV